MQDTIPFLHSLKAPLAAMLAIVPASLCAVLCGCASARVSTRHESGAAPVGKPSIVYVSDFDLDAAQIKSEPGMLPIPKAPGPLGELIPLPGAPKHPATVARELVDSMSASLVRDLSKAGLTARRLAPSEPVPTKGWLVRGVFTEVSQGNQLRRAVIGFGAGKTELQALVNINDLNQGAPRNFYELGAAADSGRAPGAGPMVALCPVGAAARFVIAGGDLNRNVRKTASKIAAEVAQRAGQPM